MKKQVDISRDGRVVMLTTEIQYGHRWDWCESRYVPLKMSLCVPRRHYTYDPTEEIYPLIVFLCGGGWVEMGKDLFIPELSWFAKRGYAVASVEYSVTCGTRFPMQIEDVKSAIRFLRAHSKELGISTENIVIMGESAGGYLSGLAALSEDVKEWNIGEYLDQSSAVQGAVCFYPPVDMKQMEITFPAPVDVLSYTPLQSLVGKNSPPIMILQGDSDTLVPDSQSDILHDAMEAAGRRCEFYLFKGADHADIPFYQDETKEMILKFIESIVK